MLSIRQLALKVGYSHATVSRALKNDPAIKPSTREKIREAAFRMGYRPNALVQGITSGRSRLIAMIVSNLASEGLARYVSMVSDLLREKGYPLMALNSGQSPEQERSCFHLAADHRVAGVLLLGSSFDSSLSHFKELIEANVPFIVLNEHSPELNAPHIYGDNREAAAAAVAEAVALGHRHFAYLAGPPKSLKDSHRFKCYRDALRSHGIELSEDCIGTTTWSPRSSQHATLQLLGRRPQTTFIYTANDEIAWGVYLAAEQLGKEIPDDLSVLGSGNLRIGALLSPQLSTIDPKTDEVAEATCELLFELMDKSDYDYFKEKPTFRTVKGVYLPRQSVGMVPGKAPRKKSVKKA